MAKYKRRIKLIKPFFQIKLVSIFLCLSIACMVVQFTLLNVALTDMAKSVPQYSLAISTEAFDIVWHHLLLTVGLMVPLTLFVGILVTFRVAGPIYRFEQHMRAIAEGEDPGDCYVRNGDEFHELCVLINQAVSRLRQDAGGTRLETETPSGAQPVSAVQPAADQGDQTEDQAEEQTEPTV